MINTFGTIGTANTYSVDHSQASPRSPIPKERQEADKMAQGQKKRRHSSTRDVNDHVNDLLRQAIRARAAAARIASQSQRAQATTNSSNINSENDCQHLTSDSEDSEDDVPLSQRSTNRSNNINGNAATSTSMPSSNASAMAFALSTPEPIISMVTECLATMKGVLDLTDRCVTDLVTLNIRELLQEREDLRKHGEWLRREMRRRGEGDDGRGGEQR